MNVTSQTKGESINQTNLRKGRKKTTAFSAWVMARVFGNISPNIRIMKVIRRMAMGKPLSPKKYTAIEVATALAAIFTKLLPISVTVRAR
jgi:hypothetical protein